MAPPIYNPDYDNANHADTAKEFNRLNGNRKHHLTQCNNVYKEYQDLLAQFDTADGVVHTDHAIKLVGLNLSKLVDRHGEHKEVLDRLQYLGTRLEDTEANRKHVADLAARVAAREAQYKEQESGLLRLQDAQKEALERDEYEKALRFAKMKAEAEAEAKAAIEAKARREKRQRRENGEELSDDDDYAGKRRKVPNLAMQFQPGKKLELDDTPMVLDEWKDQFARYIALSDFSGLGDYEENVLSIFKANVSAAVLSSVLAAFYGKEAVRPVLPNKDKPDELSVYQALDQIWSLKYPLNTLRESFFQLRQAENQSYDEFLVLLHAHAEKARIAEMKPEDIKTFILLNGIRSKYPDILSRLTFAGKDTTTVSTNDITALVHATQAVENSKPSGGAAINRIQHRGGRQPPPAFLSLTGDAKIKAMEKEGLCFRCAKPHGKEPCRYRTETCSNCKKVGHLRVACKQPLANKGKGGGGGRSSTSTDSNSVAAITTSRDGGGRSDRAATGSSRRSSSTDSGASAQDRNRQ